MTNTYVVRGVKQRICIDHVYHDVEKDIVFKHVTKETLLDHFPNLQDRGGGVLLIVVKETGKVALRASYNIKEIVNCVLRGRLGYRENRGLALVNTDWYDVYYASDVDRDIILHPDVQTVKFYVADALKDKYLKRIKTAVPAK